MDAKLSPPSVRHRRPSGVRPWTRLVLGLLLMAGTLIQACSDNNGSTGPTFACRENAVGAEPDGSGSVGWRRRAPRPRRRSSATGPVALRAESS